MSEEESKKYSQQSSDQEKRYEHNSPSKQNSLSENTPNNTDKTEIGTPTIHNNASNESKTMSSTTLTQTTAYNPSNSQQQQLIFPPSDVKHFVGGFSTDVTEENLRSYFSKFGAVSDVKIMRDPINNQSKGFGFVTMAEPSSKSRIFDEKEHIICGKKASVRPYTETDVKDTFTEGPILKRKIFVGGVNPALGHDILENYFSKYGPLEDATIMRYPDGRSRGFGFVVFRDEAACQQVLQQRNHCVTPRDKVEVKPCLSRGKSRPMCGGTMSSEPYYRYSGGGPVGMSGHFQPYSSGASGGYGYSGGGYYNPPSMYGYYGRSYDVYSGGNGSGWGGGDYRDWWSPYDSYGGYYSGGWQGGSGGYGVSGSHQGPYGPASKAAAIDSAPPPRGSSSDVGYYEMGHGGAGTGSGGSRSYSHMMAGGNVMPVLPPGGSGGSSMGPSDLRGPHVYSHMRRGPGNIHSSTPGYSLPRNRGGGY